MFHEEMLACAICAAYAGAKEILQVYDGGYHVETKSDNSPVTTADINSQKAICAILNETQIPIIGEESEPPAYSRRKDWEQLWLVDPLDGTKEFIKRNGEFTINIALVEEGRPLIGVIYVPVADQLYYNVVGDGAYRLTKASAHPSRESARRLPFISERKGYTVVGSRSHRSIASEYHLNELKAQHGDVAIVTKGSAWKFGLVAEGTADEYPRFTPTMEWDTAAGDAIIQTMGGEIVESTTRELLEYNKEDLTSPHFIAYGKAIM